jgi:hypothetical protein
MRHRHGAMRPRRRIRRRIRRLRVTAPERATPMAAAVRLDTGGHCGAGPGDARGLLRSYGVNPLDPHLYHLRIDSTAVEGVTCGSL